MKKNLIIIFAFIYGISYSQEKYTLQRCLETGLERNYDIRIVRNQEKIADNNVTIGNAGFLPSIDLSAGVSGTLYNKYEQKYTDGSENNISDVLNEGANLGLSLSWTLFDGFQMQTSYQRLKQYRSVGELNTRLVIENWIAGLVAEYYNFVQQNIRQSNLRYAVALSRERLRIAEAKYEIGADSKLDMEQARVDFNADSSSLIKQYEQLYASQIALNRMMALDEVAGNIALTDSVINLNLELDELSLLSEMQQANSELLLADRNKYISELDYKALKSRNYPYLRLSAGYGYTINKYGASSMERQNTLGLNGGLTLGFSVFDGFNRGREQKNARITIQNRQLQYEQTILALKSDLATMWMSYQNNIKLINLERENLETAHQNYEKAIESYRLGTFSGLELREAQNSLLGAEERLLQAQYNTKLCEISLLQISGRAGEYLK
ncbi:MAG: TolC family protein [Dysgonamonadaceae bacterium]|jgi:outer membrane protein TolC|nr:TolC family protein [Dysgonamonadaceae bacterium]